MSAGGRRDADLISCRRSSELMSAGGGRGARQPQLMSAGGGEAVHRGPDGRAMGAASAGSPRRCGCRLCTDAVSFIDRRAVRAASAPSGPPPG